MTIKFRPAWQFKDKGLAGYILGGHEHGVHLIEGVDGSPVTRWMCMNLEHYFARSHGGGLFVPRRKVEAHMEHVEDGTVMITIAPFEKWRVTASVSYRILSDRIIEARFEFVFGASYQDFEVFISNYFHSPVEPYVHLAGAWKRPELTDREHRYWARGARDADVIADGRLDELGAYAKTRGGFDWAVDPHFYDFPIMITPIGESGWSVIHIVERKACPSLSANRTSNAHDFSLIGHDVREGERIACRAWMIYAKLASLDDAIPLYERLTGETAQSKDALDVAPAPGLRR